PPGLPAEKGTCERTEPARTPARGRRATTEVDGRGRHYRAGALEQRSRPRSRSWPRWCCHGPRDERPPGDSHRPPCRPLSGFAALPMQRPDACADELVRAVKDLRFVGTLINGTTEGRFLDHPSYDGLLAAAVELDVPIYIHPHLPPEPVRQAYYSDLQPGAGRVLESAAWGWH